MELYEVIINYIKPYKILKERLKNLNDKLEVAEYNHTGLKAVRYDVVSSGGGNPALKEEKRLDELDAIEYLKALIYSNKTYLESIEDILNQLDNETKEIVLGVYCMYPRKRSYEYYSKRYHISINALRYRVIKALNLVHIP